MIFTYVCKNHADFRKRWAITPLDTLKNFFTEITQANSVNTDNINTHILLLHDVHCQNYNFFLSFQFHFTLNMSFTIIPTTVREYWQAEIFVAPP